MNKPIVFISHITEEKEMAIELKKLIEDSFLGMMEVFVSSDENSISSGSRWLDNITNALGSCAIELILCSPKSIQRPWVNFEAGAGWIRDIPVIPLCHSGMKPSKLPLPLNLLQAVEISELSSLKLIFPVLANSIGAQCPKIVFDNFVERMKQLEDKYTFWNDINEALRIFKGKYKNIFDLLKTQIVRIMLQETDIKEIEKDLSLLIAKEYISITKLGGVSVTPKGMFFNVEIIATNEYRKLFEDANCEVR